jgi:Glycerophosphoryl diester phosphodiesterase
MSCIAHRGFAAVNPENTLAAVEGAVDAGADGVELDVRACGSGDPVVVHDATVNRVTGTSGAVADYGPTALAALDVLGSGEGVPTLAAVCRTVPSSVRLHLELKEPGVAAAAVAVARRHDCDVVVSSRLPAALADISGVKRAYIFDSATEQGFETAADLGCVAVHPHWQLCTDSFVTAAHERGFAVNAWTATDRESARAMVAAGADGVITDSPEYCESLSGT